MPDSPPPIIAPLASYGVVGAAVSETEAALYFVAGHARIYWSRALNKGQNRLKKCLRWLKMPIHKRFIG